MGLRLFYRKDYLAMYTVFDVANWFLQKEPMTHKKLQKLCYYAQAWHCALCDGTPLIDGSFEAWVHGPVNRELWNRYKNFMPWENITLDNSTQNTINGADVSFMESVWATYGELKDYELEALTHREKPWLIARGDLGSDRICTNLISNKEMQDYYLSIYIGDGRGE